MKYPSYMDAAADYARSTEQPITQGMLFTFGFVSAPAPEYEGFVYAVTGANDWGFCTVSLGNCDDAFTSRLPHHLGRSIALRISG